MIDWDDAPLIVTFYNGLKERVKDEIARVDRPDEIDDMIKLAVRIDDRQYEREMEKKKQGRQPFAQRTKKDRHEDEMDIDSV
jgi:hypothetical protein